MTNKAKPIQLIPRIWFFLGWVILTTLIFYLSELTPWLMSRITQVLSIDGFSPIPLIMLALFIAFIGYLQQFLIYKFLVVRIKWWWLLTALAYTLSIVLQETLWMNMYSDVSGAEVNYFQVFIVSSLLRYGLIGMVQAWLLRHHLNRVWMCAFAFIFVGFIYGYIDLLEYYSIVIGLLSGVVFLWLHHISDKQSDTQESNSATNT